MSKLKDKCEIKNEEHHRLGYHTTEIKKGVIGEFSKIEEEFLELKDARLQGVRVMELVELSDLLGSIELYLERHFRGFTLRDLLDMKEVTRRAFQSKQRK